MSPREQFISKVAKAGSVTKTQVKEVLSGLEIALYDELREGRDIPLFTGFVIEPKVIPPRKFHSNLFGYDKVSKGRLGCRLHTKQYFIDRLNNNRDE